ncbi:MAG: hypothetical protein GF416_06410 [Candidatus Altiarchaeales archaeon]|nr:hypothetical protein [Candidatus Altiarchaeales archaeon]MBD3416747.1 hypothetical protein [Candidatus Altiarchaeales archaeon]
MGEGQQPPAGVNPDRVGIFMDVLDNIISDLNDNAELQKVFGVPVSRALVVVADNNDLRIEEGGRVPLNEEQQQLFLRVLDEVIRANSV